MQNEMSTTNTIAALSVSMVALFILSYSPGIAADRQNGSAGFRRASNATNGRYDRNTTDGTAVPLAPNSPNAFTVSTSELLASESAATSDGTSKIVPIPASENTATPESAPTPESESQSSDDKTAEESGAPSPAQVKPNDAGIAAGDGGCVRQNKEIPQPTQPPQEEDQETLLSDAGLLLRQGKQTELIELTNKILKKWPDCVEAQSMRGMAYLAVEKIPEAIADLTAAIDSKKMRSRQVLMYLSRGVAYSHQDKYGEAIADLTSAIAIDPKNQQLWLTRGSLYQRSKNFDKAVEDLTRGVQLDPNGPNQAIFLSARADVYSQAGKSDLALKDLNRAVKLKPQDPNAYMNRAAEYIKTKNWPNAIQDLDKVIDLAPMGKLSNNALLLRASSLKNAGRLEESLKDYSNLVLAYRSDPKFLSARAEVYLALGQNEKALDDMNACLKKDKSQKQYYELHAKICQAMNLLVEESKDREQIKLLESKSNSQLKKE